MLYKSDRVVVNDKDSLFYQKKGKIVYLFSNLFVEVVLDNKTTIIIADNKLKKLKKKS